MFQHDLEHSVETSDEIENPETLGLAWKFKTGSEVISSPAISGKNIYVRTADSHVYCMNKTTGEVEWKFAACGVILSPTISGNYVYFGSDGNYPYPDYDDNNVYCLNKNTGEVVWKFKTGGFVQSSLAISENYVYVSSRDGYLYAFKEGAGGASSTPQTSEEGTPGFETVFAITGLLVVAYILRRGRKKRWPL